MSQHILKTELDGKPVQLIIGWDRPLRQYFYSLHDLTPGVEDSVLGSSMMLDQDELHNIDPILDDLKQLGITPPEKMVEEVQADEVNGGSNRIEQY
jgi:hypothetical protein